MKNIKQTIKDMPETFVKEMGKFGKNKYVQKAALGLAGIGTGLALLTGCDSSGLTPKQFEQAAWAEFNYKGFNPTWLATYEGLEFGQQFDVYLQEVEKRNPGLRSKYGTGEPLGKIKIPDLDGNGKVGADWENSVAVNTQR